MAVALGHLFFCLAFGVLDVAQLGCSTGLDAGKRMKPVSILDSLFFHKKIPSRSITDCDVFSNVFVLTTRHIHKITFKSKPPSCEYAVSLTIQAPTYIPLIGEAPATQITLWL